MDDLTIPQSSATIELDYDSNLLLGLIGGAGAMLISAIIWGAITYFTGFQISWMAIGVGAFVGWAVHKLGKGKSQTYGFTGGALSLLGCLLGNFLFYNGILAREWEVPFINVLLTTTFDFTMIVELFRITFDFRDVLFYLLATFIGFGAATGFNQAKKK